MTLPRRRWLVAACVAVAAMVLAGWWLWPQPPSGVWFTRAQYDRIRNRMTLAEVQMAVGMPPCRYGVEGRSCDGHWVKPWVNDLVYTRSLPSERRQATHLRVEEWIGEDGSRIHVLLASDRGQEPTVIAKSWKGHTPEWQLKARAWLARLRALVGP